MTDTEIEKLALAIAEHQRSLWAIEERAHYDSHQRIDRMLAVYDNASNAITKALIGLLIAGMLWLASVAIR